MAKNLERQLLVTMLYNKIIGRFEKQPKTHHQLGGLVKSNRAAKFEEYADCIEEWIAANHAYEFSADCEYSAALNFAVYKKIDLIFNDATNAAKNIEQIAHANEKWGHNEENELFDFVVIENLGPKVPGLGGIQIGRIIFMTQGTPRSTRKNDEPIVRMDYVISLAVVRMLERVETNNPLELFPVYRYTKTIEVVETLRLVRTAHMVQNWSSAKDDMEKDQSKDTLDDYESMIWNTHSDMHAWNTYYDAN